MTFLLEVLILLLLPIWLCVILANALLKEPPAKLWLVEPPWSGDGRKYIINAQSEQEADHIYMRKICGWTAVMKDERSQAKITPLILDQDGVITVG